MNQNNVMMLVAIEDRDFSGHRGMVDSAELQVGDVIGVPDEGHLLASRIARIDPGIHAVGRLTIRSVNSSAPRGWETVPASDCYLIATLSFPSWSIQYEYLRTVLGFIYNNGFNAAAAQHMLDTQRDVNQWRPHSAIVQVVGMIANYIGNLGRACEIEMDVFPEYVKIKAIAKGTRVRPRA